MIDGEGLCWDRVVTGLRKYPGVGGNIANPFPIVLVHWADR
jgi:hypothetical protein